MKGDENVFHCFHCHRAGIKSDKDMWSRRTREMLDAKHPASVNVHKLRCLECTAQDHSQDTHAMQRLCPGPKPYDKCSLCDVVLVHTKGPDCNVSKAQWTSKRHGDRLCFDCVANKRARCCPSKAEADAGGKGQEAVVGAVKVAGGVVAGGMLVQATQSTGACTWSPQTGMSTTGKRRAVESKFEDLPNCTWEEYCSRHGIQSALKAKTLLLKLAGKLRKSGVEEVPPIFDATGRQNGKEPLICWLWALEADFFLKMMNICSVLCMSVVGIHMTKT